MICMCSSLMTYFMMPQPAKDALKQAAGDRDDLARPKRREPSGGNR